MSRRVILSRRADSDLDEHFLYIAEDNAETARRFLEALQAAFERLLEMPEIGPLQYFTHPAPSGNGARDLPRLLEEGD